MRSRVVTTLIVLSALLLSNVSSAEINSHSQTLASLKAAYVYNIAKFTEWPKDKLSSKTAPITFCVYGSSEVSQSLLKINGRNIGSHIALVIEPESEAEFSQCHLLYISPSEKRRYRYVLSLVDRKRVVTISDDERFIRNGGLVNLVPFQQRLRFEINRGLLATQELTISSHLLKLAILVDE